MNISALKTFLTVVALGNLNKAAERLNVTQSTVTARLDALEAALGQRLLVRSRRGAALTKAGFAFQRHAELAVQSWEQAVKAVELPRGFSGLFSFACHAELWEGAGEDWLSRVRQERPGLALEAWPGSQAEGAGWLASGLVDLALLPEAVTGPDLACQEFLRERLLQVATRPRRVQAWDPAYVFVDLGADFRRQHSLAWPGDETAHMTFGGSLWARDYLLRKGGSAYLPWRLSRDLVRQGRLFPVEGAPVFTRPLFLAWRQASLATHPWIEAACAWQPEDL